VGSLIFGLLAFVVGRRRIFLVSLINIQITLALYFFGVLFSGIETHPVVFIIARFVTGLRYGWMYVVWEDNSQLYSQELISLCLHDIEGGSISA